MGWHYIIKSGDNMDVWIGVLAFVLFLGFGTAVMVCVNAIKRQSGIIIKSRIKHKIGGMDVIIANLGLVVFVILMYFHLFLFVPAILCFVLFIVLSTQIQSGLTEDGAMVGTTFIDWEFMEGYKFVNDETDSNVVILKIRANRRQYVLVCDRKDKKEINDIFEQNYVNQTQVIKLD